jgi:hypothetical protein
MKMAADGTWRVQPGGAGDWVIGVEEKNKQ